MRSMILFALIGLLIFSGCIRTYDNVVAENCAEKYVESDDLKTVCYKNQAAFFAATGHNIKAIDACVQIKNLHENVFLERDLVYSSIFAGDSYNACIKRVAYYAKDESICSLTDPVDFDSITEVMQVLISLDADRAGSIVDANTNLHKEECIKRVQYIVNMDREIKKNYELIGFVPIY